MTLSRRAVVQRFVGGKIVAVAKTVEIGAADGEERGAPVERFQLVEIEGEEKDSVEKAVGSRRKASVQHMAFVETGIHQRPEFGPVCYASGRSADAFRCKSYPCLHPSHGSPADAPTSYCNFLAQRALKKAVFPRSF